MLEYIKLDEPVHEFLNCRKRDALIMLYAYQVRHKISWVALIDLYELINLILENNALPTTKYMFKQIFPTETGTVHFVCEHCGRYLGATMNEKEIRCTTCNKTSSASTKYKKNYFITLHAENQLTDAVADLHENNLLDEMERIELTVCTDGVVVQKAAKHKSLWPIQFFINNVNLKHRFKQARMMCAGFSFGKTADMQSLFRPFIEEINEINRNGGVLATFRSDGGEIAKRLKVVVTKCTADSQAKCYLLSFSICYFAKHFYKTYLTRKINQL